jgi:hypothetical protein
LKNPQCLTKDEDFSKDTVKKLPEPIANKILKYLRLKELLSAMEVSKLENNFTKVRSGLKVRHRLKFSDDDESNLQ